ncbi:MAG: hypothetical protein ACI3XP_01495 [Eubacteriales bacterium]
MNDYDEKSYKRYKRYRLNKHIYEQEQIFFPLSIILIGTVIAFIWHYILFAIMLVAIAVLTFFLLEKHFSKQMHSAQKLIISSKEAQSGVEIEATIKNLQKPTTIILRIPPKTKNGQKYIARNVEIQDKSLKK